MEYQGHIAKVELDESAGLLHGEVINTRDVITFEAESVKELEQAFHESVDDYLAFCAERGEEPDRPFSGRFVVRVSPELHRRIFNRARLADKSLNGWVSELLEAAAHSD